MTLYYQRFQRFNLRFHPPLEEARIVFFEAPEREPDEDPRDKWDEAWDTLRAEHGDWFSQNPGHLPDGMGQQEYIEYSKTRPEVSWSSILADGYPVERKNWVVEIPEKMNGYQFVLHTPTYHNDHFIGNIPDYLVVHADSEIEARAKVQLKPAGGHQVHEGLFLRKEAQTVYSVTCLGRVVTRVITEYEKDD